jgi:hypothetical protein
MVLLGGEAQVDARFGLFGDSANLDAREVHGLRRTYHRLRNRLGHIRWISYVTLVLSVQDRCTACAKRTIGTKIVLDAPDGSPM